MSGLMKLPCHLEGDESPEAVATYQVGSGMLMLLYLPHVIRSTFLHTLEGDRCTIQSICLYGVKIANGVQ